MSLFDVYALAPFIVLGGAAVVVMLVAAFFRNHALIAGLSALGFVVALVSLATSSRMACRPVTKLLVMDHYAIFYCGLLLLAGLVVSLLSFGYLEKSGGRREELYILLLVATLGAMTLVASNHFASFLLGLETLSVSLYALVSHNRGSPIGTEAGVKYLVLASVSTAFLVFGMALVYAQLGAIEFAPLISIATTTEPAGILALAGIAMIIVAVGFKLSFVPFHLWAPDVFEGAPAPVTAFIATVSKGSVFALMLRYFTQINVHQHLSLFTVFTLLAIASMFIGNLLALLQNNVKRILAYSSISHMGYLLVAFLASGPLAVTAVTYYLVAYFIATLGVFAVIALLSTGKRDAGLMEDFEGLAWSRPWLAATFTAMLLSLAGIPLTAGFVGKFYVLVAGVNSRLWPLVIILVVNSALGLFYYLRIVATVYHLSEGNDTVRIQTPVPQISGAVVLSALTLLLIWVGVYPPPLIHLIERIVPNLF